MRFAQGAGLKTAFNELRTALGDLYQLFLVQLGQDGVGVVYPFTIFPDLVRAWFLHRIAAGNLLHSIERHRFACGDAVNN
ncbi:hypothetical protein D3C81_2199840 [compost metagenome]